MSDDKHNLSSLPAGVGDPQLRHLWEENRELRRQLREALAQGDELMTRKEAIENLRAMASREHRPGIYSLVIEEIDWLRSQVDDLKNGQRILRSRTMDHNQECSQVRSCACHHPDPYRCFASRYGEECPCEDEFCDCICHHEDDANE